MQAVYDCSSFPRTIPWNDHVFATKLTAGCDWKTRIWSATTFECLHEPGWGGSGVHMFSFKYQKILMKFCLIYFPLLGPTLEYQLRSVGGVGAFWASSLERFLGRWIFRWGQPRMFSRWLKDENPMDFFGIFCLNPRL